MLQLAPRVSPFVPALLPAPSWLSLADFAPAPAAVQPMKAVIIEDDPAALELLRHHLVSLRSVDVVREVTDFAEASRVLSETQYDLVFLDIQVGDGNGLELFGRVRRGAEVIFVTNDERHAARAFELNALDYIVKPVTAARLEQALRRLAPSRSHPSVRPDLSLADRIFLKGAAGRGRYVVVREIQAIVSSENYTDVLLAGGERCLVRRTMQEWARLLPREDFARIHRTVIVNLHALERIERTSDENAIVHLHGLQRSFSVSRRLWPSLRARADQLAIHERKSLDRHTGPAVRHRRLAGPS